MHSRISEPSGIEDFAAVLASFLFPFGIALWVLADARRRRLALPYGSDFPLSLREDCVLAAS